MDATSGSDHPPATDIARIADLTGARPIRFQRAPRGYTPAQRWIVTLEGGSSVFAKIGVDALTARSLRAERSVYATLQGDFMPEVRGWDDGDRPMLLLEDLSACFWPPPWNATRVDQVLAALARLRAIDVGGALSPLSENDRDLAGSW